MNAEEYLNSMEGLHPELYEEEYRRNMKGIIAALFNLGERGLGWKVDSRLKEHIRENDELKMRFITSDNTRWLSMWVDYLKRIPKQGLNNLTRKTSWDIRHAEFRKQHGIEWKGEPTLPRRLKSICISQSWFGGHRLPFFYFHMDARAGHEVETIPEVHTLTKQIIERLEELYEKMDTVTVLKESELQYWKDQIKYSILWIRKQSRWVGLEQLLEDKETEFEVLESTPSVPLIEEIKEEKIDA